VFLPSFPGWFPSLLPCDRKDKEDFTFNLSGLFFLRMLSGISLPESPTPGESSARISPED
jgi:hypothetical protein